MRQISSFYLFLIVVWWPLPLLPGVTPADISGPLAITILAGFCKLLAKLPNQGGPDWRNLGGRHKVRWQTLLLAVVGLQAVLLVYLWIFGAGHEQVEPYAGWLAPLGEAMTQLLPKFRLMASKIAEMSLPHRVNVVLVAYGITYAWQPVLAALWIVPAYRLYTEAPPDKLRQMRGWRRFGYLVLSCIMIAALLAMIVLIPEASEFRGRRDFFHEFEARDPHLFYQCVVWVTAYCQGLVLLLLFLFAICRAKQTRAVAGGQATRGG